MVQRRRRHIVPKNIVAFLVLLFFGMGLGYAVLAENFLIDGSAQIAQASWDIHFTNLQVTSGSVTAHAPTVTDTTVSFGATLALPGDYYEFTVDVLNAGTLDAKLDSISISPTLTSAQAEYFQYTVTYADGAPISVGDALNHSDSSNNVSGTETIRVRFEYKERDDTTLYPTTDQTFNCSVSLYYVQGHGTPHMRKKYSFPEVKVYNGQALPSGVITSDDFDDVKHIYSNANYHYDFSVKHYLLNGVVAYSSIIVSNGSITREFVPSADSYSANRDAADAIFGAGICQEQNYHGSPGYNCLSSFFSVSETGYLKVGPDADYCWGNSDGSVECMQDL